MPASASAATVVTLTGETLNASPFVSTSTSTCATGPTGTSTITYDVTGVATGPYPGTFEESGSITFTETQVLSFSAHFEIDSAAGDVVGDKTYDPSEIPAIATCDETGGDLFARVIVAERYTAEITGSAAGDFTDTGRSQLILTVQSPQAATGLRA